MLNVETQSLLFNHFNGLARDRVARLNGDLLLFNPLRTGNVLSLSVSTFSEQMYYLEFNHSLGPNGWVALPGVLGDGGVKIFQNAPSGNTPTFYRVRQE